MEGRNRGNRQWRVEGTTKEPIDSNEEIIINSGKITSDSHSNHWNQSLVNTKSLPNKWYLLPPHTHSLEFFTHKFHPSHFSSIVQSLLFPLICPSIRLISFFLPFSSFSHSHSIKIIIFEWHHCDSLIKII